MPSCANFDFTGLIICTADMTVSQLCLRLNPETIALLEAFANFYADRITVSVIFAVAHVFLKSWFRREYLPTISI